MYKHRSEARHDNWISSNKLCGRQYLKLLQNATLLRCNRSKGMSSLMYFALLIKLHPSMRALKSPLFKIQKSVRLRKISTLSTKLIHFVEKVERLVANAPFKPCLNVISRFPYSFCSTLI